MIKLFENFQSDKEIHELCIKYNINHYKINDDKTISVNSNVSLYGKSLIKIQLSFKEVSGWFDCGRNALGSLEGSPIFVGGDFNCSGNRFLSFVNGPKRIDGDYDCFDNKNLILFTGFPEHIGGEFFCDKSPLEEVWDLFKDKDKVELLNEMNPLRNIDGPHVILDIFNDFLSIIGKKEVREIEGYINI